MKMNRSGTKINKYDILFDSLLELDIYEEFKSRGIKLQRGLPITVTEKFESGVKCFTNDNKAFAFKLESPKVREIVYTPDFILPVDNYNVYIELKGFANETFRYRWKLFKRLLEEKEPNALIFLVKRRHNGRVKPKDNEARIIETKQIVDNILTIIEQNNEQ